MHIYCITLILFIIQGLKKCCRQHQATLCQVPLCELVIYMSYGKLFKHLFLRTGFYFYDTTNYKKFISD